MLSKLLVMIGLFAGASEGCFAGEPLRLEMNTGIGLVLDRRVVEVEGPVPAEGGALRFDVEFATDERILPGEVVDAFTLTLRNPSGSVLLPLVTVDAFGPTWLPTSPGATLPDSTLWAQNEISVPPREGFFRRSRQSAVFELPPGLLAQPLQLVASLFDNLDTQPSVAVVDGVRIVSSLRLPIVLQSSASLFGPFASELSAQVDRASRTVRLRRPGPHRFFRLNGDTASRIVRISKTAGGWALDYQAEVGTPVLRVEGSNDRSLFSPVPDARIDLAARTARISLFRSFAFFRMVGSQAVRVVGDEVSGEDRILRFEVAPKVPAVESSSQPGGPFAPEDGVQSDAFARRISVPIEGFTRYFRLSTAVALRVTGLTLTETEWVLHYDER